MARVRKTKAGLNLKRWFKEDWRTLSGDKDYSKGDRTFRPTKRFQVKLLSLHLNLLNQRKVELEERKERRVECLDIASKRRNDKSLYLQQNQTLTKQNGNNNCNDYFVKHRFD